MAFTAGEFTKGAFAAYGIFVVGVIPVSALVFGISGAGSTTILAAMFAPFSAGAVGGAALLVIGCPLALCAGLLLRRTDRLVAHLIAHGTVGVVVALLTLALGSVATMLAADPPQLRPPDLSELIILPGIAWIAPYVLLTGISATLGWMTTAMPAIRRDRIARVGLFASGAPTPEADSQSLGTSSIRSESAGNGLA